MIAQQISPLISIFLDLSLVPDTTFLGHSIRVACDEGVPVREICRTILEQSRDNREVVVNCIGEDLMRKIEAI